MSGRMSDRREEKASRRKADGRSDVARHREGRWRTPRWGSKTPDVARGRGGTLPIMRNRRPGMRRTARKPREASVTRCPIARSATWRGSVSKDLGRNVKAHGGRPVGESRSGWPVPQCPEGVQTPRGPSGTNDRSAGDGRRTSKRRAIPGEGRDEAARRRRGARHASWLRRAAATTCSFRRRTSSGPEFA
jgi:hypothetical protein